MSNYEYDYNTETQETEQILRLNAGDMAEIASRMSGLRRDGSAKVSVSYSAYDFEAPEDDAEKNKISFADIARAELSVDKVTGFYTLDLVFKNSDDATLKMMWAALQRHKSNEVFQCDKTWIFYIKLIEEENEDESEEMLFTADILNPLAFYLIRTIPNQLEFDYEVEQGVYCGGNTIRFLLHRDLVTFQYENVEEFVEENEE